MTEEELDAALRAFRRRRPFRSFLIEFNSGTQLKIVHPEAVRRERTGYVMRAPDGGFVVFSYDGVTRLLDLPISS